MDEKNAEALRVAAARIASTAQGDEAITQMSAEIERELSGAVSGDVSAWAGELLSAAGAAPKRGRRRAVEVPATEATEPQQE